MIEITCYDLEGETVGTWDIPEEELAIGYCWERMEIIEVHPVPLCGSATVTVVFY